MRKQGGIMLWKISW